MAPAAHRPARRSLRFGAAILTATAVLIAPQAAWPTASAAPGTQSPTSAERTYVTFTSIPSWPARVGAHYHVFANSSPAELPVRFSVTRDSGAVCRVAGAVVTYLAEGLCTVVASQRGDESSAPAVAQQPISIFPAGTGPHRPIRHIVLIFQENHSFDETLGAYCATRATPCDGYVGPVRLADGHRVRMRHSSDIVPDVEHDVDGQLRAVDGGAMDGWQTLSGCQAGRDYACLTYYTPDDVPNLTTLADQFVVSDRTFSEANSPSFGGHLYAASATLDGFTGKNPHAIPGAGHGLGWGCDSRKVAEWSVAPGAPVIDVPSCVPAADGSGPFQASPVQHVPTIFDEFDAARVPWKIYGATPDAADDDSQGYVFSICPTFADCLYTDQVDNLVPSAQILHDAAKGSLPAYSVLTPSASSAEVIGTVTSQHNGSSMIAGDNWIGKVVSAIEGGPDWDSTAIFITYDDCGCFYDHVPPPLNADGSAQGIRLPMVIVSPFARPGYTDSTNASLASVLALAERVFGVPPLSAVDAAAYDYGQSFQLDQKPRQGVGLAQHPVPESSIRYARAHADEEDDAT